MTLCPVALVAGCKKCPVFSVCLAKSLIGDYKKDADKKTVEKDEKKGSG